MLKTDTKRILDQSRSRGWILEPDAKKMLQARKMVIPESVLTDDINQAREFMNNQDGPVVLKAVSSSILHKTEFDAVALNIQTQDELSAEFNRLLTLEGCKNILVEQMASGIEVIVGAKIDFQFGPVVVFGLGGTAVEIYNDTAIRMAPLSETDVPLMIDNLQAKALIKGYRGRPGVNMEGLTQLLVNFSQMVMELENDIESIDLNPVICDANQCTIADARIMLAAR